MLKLNSYTDETYTEVRETRERERVKIPYSVTKYVLGALQDLDFNDGDKVLRRVLASEEQLTLVVRATFGLTVEDLDFVDTLEMADTATQIINFVIDKMAELGISAGADDPNAQAPATTA